jgi:hypothetical protein
LPSTERVAGRERAQHRSQADLVHPLLRPVARRQHGVFTLRQARQAGMSARDIDIRVLEGDWLPVMADVVRCAGTPVTDRMKSWTAILAIGRPVAMTGCWAARHLGLDRAPEERRPHLVIPVNRRRPELPGVDVRRVTRAAWTSWNLTSRDGLPVAPLPVVLRDVAATTDRATACDIVQHALRRNLLQLDDLHAVLRRGASGSAVLRDVLEELAPGYQSMWERRLHRGLLKIGVVMTPQVRVVAVNGAVAYLDLGREDLMFGVEVDGFVNHMARFAADRKRARMLALDTGWTVPVYAVEEIRRDCDAVVREIAREVRRRERNAA